MKTTFILIMFAMAVYSSFKTVFTKDIFKGDIKAMLASFYCLGMLLAYYWLACLILEN